MLKAVAVFVMILIALLWVFFIQKDKKTKKIIGIGIAIYLMATGIAAVGIGFTVVTVLATHTSILESQIDRQPEEYDSFDGSFHMYVAVEEDTEHSIHYVNSHIYDTVTREEVLCVGYRAFDFHWVKWEKESNNFWLYSGDLGTFCYRYQGNNAWKRYTFIIDEDGDYLLKGEYNNDVIDIEDIPISERLMEDRDED